MTASPDSQASLTELAAAVECATDPLALLVALHLLAEAVGACRAEAVRDARAGGIPWSQIGSALSVSRQSAQARYGSPSTASEEAGSGDGADERAASTPSTARTGRAGRVVGYALTTPGGRTLLRLVPHKDTRTHG